MANGNKDNAGKRPDDNSKRNSDVGSFSEKEDKPNVSFDRLPEPKEKDNKT